MIRVYKTSDLALASVLNLEVAPKSFEPDLTNPRKQVFVFDLADKQFKKIELFFNKKLKVEPVLYFNSIREMKNRVYDHH